MNAALLFGAGLAYGALLMLIVIRIVRRSGTHGFPPEHERRSNLHLRNMISIVTNAARADGDIASAHNTLYKLGVPNNVRIRVMEPLSPVKSLEEAGK